MKHIGVTADLTREIGLEPAELSQVVLALEAYIDRLADRAAKDVILAESPWLDGPMRRDCADRAVAWARRQRQVEHLYRELGGNIDKYLPGTAQTPLPFDEASAKFAGTVR